MPKSGPRLWIFAVTIATAVTLVSGYLLRLRYPALIADPIAQAIGFTLGFVLGWPWFKRNNPEQLKFGPFLTFVAALAVIIAVIRIRYIS